MSATAASFDLIARLRPDFLRFAKLQVRDPDIAEDLVQETLEAALEGIGKFNNQSSLKTWVFGILKNKIIDHLRRKDRSISFSDLAGDADDSDAVLDALFNEKGFWNVEARPVEWNAPEQALESQQFWKVFDACLNHLPENVSRVFMMREFLGFDASEICQQLKLTTSNCHVILHRARTRLRVCLEDNWFQSGAQHA
jgi:RNA polymerase sigma-70 factor (ECF subfamily)